MAQKNFVNLIGIVDALKSDTRFPRLRPKLLTALRAQSCLADLQLAQSCSDALDRIEPDPEKDPELEESTIWNALLQQGILLYARATSTSGPNERGAIKLNKDNLSTDALVDHNKLVRHRNEVIAHVQSDEDVFHSQTAYLVGTDATGYTYLATTRRVHIDGELCASLRRQTPIAIGVVDRITNQHFFEVLQLLAKLRVPLEIWQSNVVDPASLFGSQTAAHEAANASGGMSVRCTVLTD